MQKWGTKLPRRCCHNCGEVLMGFRNVQGVLKLRCPICGWEEVGRKVGSRHERCDFYVLPRNDIRQLNTEY